jgi:hypothetical protein
MRNNHYRGSRDWNDNHPGSFNNRDREQWNRSSYYNGGDDHSYRYNNRGRYEDEYDEFLNQGANRRDNNWNDGQSYYGYRDERNMGNFIERAGEKLRDTWRRWTHRDDHDDNYSRGYGDHDHSYYNRSENRGNRYNNNYPAYHSNYHRHGDDRNFFERAGEKIKEKWHDWMDRDERDHDHDHGYRNNSYRYQDEGHEPGEYRGRPEHFPHDRNERRYGTATWSSNNNRGGRYHRPTYNRRQYSDEFLW